jgi:hypothetical protein
VIDRLFNEQVASDGSVNFKEEDGIDYAAVTVQLPGGERVLFRSLHLKQTQKKNTHKTWLTKQTSLQETWKAKSYGYGVRA